MSLVIEEKPALSEDEFKSLTPAKKQAYLKTVMFKAQAAFDVAFEARKNEVNGSAFLWVSLCRSDALTRAFRAYIKKNHERRVMNNYRGTSYAWYFGSQTSHGYWDGLNAMCKVLSAHGVTCFTCDEWD